MSIRVPTCLPPDREITLLMLVKSNSTSGIETHDRLRLTSTSPIVDSRSSFASTDSSPSASASCAISSVVSPLKVRVKKPVMLSVSALVVMDCTSVMPFEDEVVSF